MNLRFLYRNWRGDTHVYVVKPESIEFSAQGGGPNDEKHWVLHGETVTRDGDPRPDMGPVRRRTFVLTAIEDLEEVPSIHKIEDEMEFLAKKLGGGWRIEQGILPQVILTVTEARRLAKRLGVS